MADFKTTNNYNIYSEKKPKRKTKEIDEPLK